MGWSVSASFVLGSFHRYTVFLYVEANFEQQSKFRQQLICGSTRRIRRLITQSCRQTQIAIAVLTNRECFRCRSTAPRASSQPIDLICNGDPAVYHWDPYLARVSEYPHDTCITHWSFARFSGVGTPKDEGHPTFRATDTGAF